MLYTHTQAAPSKNPRGAGTSCCRQNHRITESAGIPETPPRSFLKIGAHRILSRMILAPRIVCSVFLFVCVCVVSMRLHSMLMLPAIARCLFTCHAQQCCLASVLLPARRLAWER